VPQHEASGRRMPHGGVCSHTQSDSGTACTPSARPSSMAKSFSRVAALRTLSSCAYASEYVDRTSAAPLVGSNGHALLRQRAQNRLGSAMAASQRSRLCPATGGWRCRGVPDCPCPTTWYRYTCSVLQPRLQWEFTRGAEHKRGGGAKSKRFVRGHCHRPLPSCTAAVYCRRVLTTYTASRALVARRHRVVVRSSCRSHRAVRTR
jgi:hypothetical protein